MSNAKNSERQDLEELDRRILALQDLVFGMQVRGNDFTVFDRLDGELGGSASSIDEYVDEILDPLHQIAKQRILELVND